MFDTVLMCPNCRGLMHNRERNGALIEQCSECGGGFLDRTELERLLAGHYAEALPIYEELAYKGRHRRARVNGPFSRRVS